MLIPYAAAVTLAALEGLGRHSDELNLNQFINATKWLIIGQTYVSYLKGLERPQNM
jgi:hypothetical protein